MNILLIAINAKYIVAKIGAGTDIPEAVKGFPSPD